mmetsp:Transcript_30388/g.67406  ORF Transcript_30388/g.67406 Transcript_30388/m.67406 type:complete len:219 (-) Transcript_30388:208-864(-)
MAFSTVFALASTSTLRAHAHTHRHTHTIESSTRISMTEGSCTHARHDHACKCMHNLRQRHIEATGTVACKNNDTLHPAPCRYQSLPQGGAQCMHLTLRHPTPRHVSSRFISVLAKGVPTRKSSACKLELQLLLTNLSQVLPCEASQAMNILQHTSAPSLMKHANGPLLHKSQIGSTITRNGPCKRVCSCRAAGPSSQVRPGITCPVGPQPSQGVHTNT